MVSKVLVTISSLALSALALASVQEQQPLTLTLQDAIQMALKLQPDIRLSQAQRDAAKARLNQAKAGFLPTITAFYDYQSTKRSRDLGHGLDTRNGDVELNYTILDTGQRELTRKQASASLKSADIGIVGTQYSVIAGVAAAYYSALRETALVQVAKSQVDRTQKVLDQTQAQVDAGAAAKKDTYQAEADLANAKVNLISATNNADVAITILRQEIGIDSAKPINLIDVPKTTPESTVIDSMQKLGLTLDSIQKLVDYALTNRQDVRQAQTAVDIQRISYRLEQVSDGPTLDVSTALGYIFSPEGNDSRILGVSVTFPIFDPAKRYRVDEAAAGVKQAEAQYDSSRTAAVQEVEQAYRTFLSARSSLGAADTAQKAAQVNYDAATASKNEGAGTIVEVITAQDLLVQAQINYVQAVYNFYAAAAGLASALGRSDLIMEGGTGK